MDTHVSLAFSPLFAVIRACSCIKLALQARGHRFEPGCSHQAGTQSQSMFQAALPKSL